MFQIRCSKKRMLAGLIYKITLISSFKRLLDTYFSKQIRILAYHRVCDVASHKNYLFDTDLISASVAQFEWQVKYIKKNFDPITFSDYIAFLDGKMSLPKRPVIITFDDGFEDNYTNAYPILKSHGIPATFFISTNYIDSKEVFWFDQLVYMVKSATKLTRIEAFDLNISSVDKIQAVRSVLGRVKELDNDSRLEGIKEIVKKVGYSVPDGGYAESRPMTWDQVAEMSRNGMEIGSHSKSHPILSKVSDELLKEELAGSKEVIESRTGHSCDVFCYPVGSKSICTEKVVNEIKKAGYRLGISYMSGVNLPRDDCFRMKRLHIEEDIDKELFVSMLSMPRMFC